MRFTLATPSAPGAIGIIQLHGSGVRDLVQRLTGVAPSARSRLVSFEDIDEGLVVLLRDDWCQLMPHGGVRVIQRLAERLRQLGAQPAGPGEQDARLIYPEAATGLEADMLARMAGSASPAAIDPLLDQPRRWAEALAGGGVDGAAILEWSDRLDRLIDPPTVVLVGRANVGKSTLSNLVLGRTASITADLPGTTRDWVAGLAELPTPIGELAVRWLDTPGLRRSDDPLERRAIELARVAIVSADVLIAVRDPEIGWPPPGILPREPDLRLINKADTIEPRSPDPRTSDGPLYLSATRGDGLDELATAVTRVLGLGESDAETPWAFSPTLRRAVAAGDTATLRHYAGV